MQSALEGRRVCSYRSDMKRRGSWWWLGCLWAVACGDPPVSDVALSVEQINVVLCQCHHGFGFGLDATAQMPVANLGDADARLTLDSVRLVAQNVQTIVEVDDPLAVADMSFGPDYNDLSFRILRPAPFRG